MRTQKFKLRALGLFVLAALTLFTPPSVQAQEGTCTPELIIPGGVPDENWGFNRNYGGLFGLYGQHLALDFKSPEGYVPFPVVASGSGTITRWEPFNQSSGGVIDIQLDECPEITIQYVHLNGESISGFTLGQHLVQGQPLGIADGSGYLSGGPHLHFKILVDGKPVDPIEKLEKESTAKKILAQAPEFASNLAIFLLTVLGLSFTLTLISNPHLGLELASAGLKQIKKMAGLAARRAPKAAKGLAQTVFDLAYWADTILVGISRLGRIASRRAILYGAWLAALSILMLTCLATITVVGERVPLSVAVEKIYVHAPKLWEQTVKFAPQVFAWEWTGPLSNIGSVSHPEILEPTETNQLTLPPIGGEKVRVKVSHYTPWAGGPSCAKFINGVCLSAMASGLPWEEYVNQAAACPQDLMYSKVYLFGKEWQCLDTGGAIVWNSDGSFWVDLLTEAAPVPFGTVVDAVLVRPENSNGGEK